MLSTFVSKGLPILRVSLALTATLLIGDILLMQEGLREAWDEIVVGLFVLTFFLEVLIFLAYKEDTILRARARLDSLTGLLNRAAFTDVVYEKLANGGQHSILIAGIDRFKNVNDVLGYAAGDELLIQSVQRLKGILESIPGAQLARVGGDEFGILLPEFDVAQAESIAVITNEMFRQPFLVQGHDTEMSISIGIVTFPNHGTNVGALTRCADIAMFHAKKAKVGYVVYDFNQDTSSVEELHMRAHLRTALEKKEIIVEYQPKVDIRGTVIGMEALMRWQHPILGLLGPDRFIPVAEHCGMIHQLTEWVLNQALNDFRKARDAGIPLKNVSVNVSPFSAFNSRFMVTVCSALAAANVEPENLVIEITETSLIHTAESLIRTLVGLNSIGVIISIDDFGTGQSSLLYLKNLPVTEIKIDRSFIHNLTKHGPDASIVKSIITLAKELNCNVCAEGVEDRLTRDELASMGCDYIQGYLISRPVALNDLLRRFA